MSESSDYNPGAWSGWDYGSARVDYDAHAGRGYKGPRSSGSTSHDPTSPGTTLPDDVVPELVETGCEAPVLVGCDLTGSMGDWPSPIFAKLPYLDHEARTEYRGEDVEFCFCGFTDVFAPGSIPALQVRPFSAKTEMATRLKEIVIHGGDGGGSMHESSETLLLYWARNARMPNAIRRPLAILVTDEMPYDFVSPDHAKAHAKTVIPRNISVEDIVAEVTARMSLYVILKPYSRGSDDSPTNERIYNRWAGLVGEKFVKVLPEANRVVDVVFGIMALEAEKLDYFQGEIEARQTKAQVKTVYEALGTTHPKAGDKSENLPVKGGSTLLKPAGPAKKSKDLL